VVVGRIKNLPVPSERDRQVRSTHRWEQQMQRPTIESAVERVRTDPDARFAAILAAVFAFSAGFVFGFLMGQIGDDEREGIELAASADVAA
jgi:hypothetical protein